MVPPTKWIPTVIHTQPTFFQESCLKKDQVPFPILGFGQTKQDHEQLNEI